MKHGDIGVDRTCFGSSSSAYLPIYFFFHSISSISNSRHQYYEENCRFGLSRVFHLLEVSLCCTKKFICPSRLWSTFLLWQFVENHWRISWWQLWAYPNTPNTSRYLKITEPPPSEEPDIEIQIVAPQLEQDRCSALAPDEFLSQDLPSKLLTHPFRICLGWPLFNSFS